MKKIITLLSVFSLFVSSCSNDDTSAVETPIDSNTILLKKMIVSDGSEVITTTITYDGKKIIKSQSDNGENSLFTYSGDNITKIEYFSAPNILDYTENYSYDSTGRLIQFTDIDGSVGTKETYVYNANGTVSLTIFSGNNVTQNTTVATGTITLQNGEVISRTEIYSFGQNTFTCNYDTKNAPFKNAIGFGKTCLKDDEGFFGANHNRTNDNFTSLGSPISNNYTFTYNSYNFPETTTSNSSVPGGNQNIQFFY